MKLLRSFIREAVTTTRSQKSEIHTYSPEFTKFKDVLTLITRCRDPGAVLEKLNNR
jgi:hypothetical protein